MRYFRPTSLTWWSGALAFILGNALIFLPDSAAIAEWAKVLSALTGGDDASPAALILFGLGIIGLRDKLERIE